MIFRQERRMAMSKYKYPFILVVASVFLAVIMALAYPRKRFTTVRRYYKK